MRRVYRLVSDFILPHLERQTFGKHLIWEDRRNGIFKISRIHQNSDMWNEQCLEVYKTWSVKKKLWCLDDRRKVTKAKHRLITALRRNQEIETLRKEELYYRFRVFPQQSTEMKVRKIPLFQPLNERQAPLALASTVENTNFSEITDFNSGWSYSDPIFIKAPQTVTTTNTNESFNDSKRFLQHSMHLQENIRRNGTMLFEEQVIKPSDKASLIDDQVKYSDKCCCEKLLDNYLVNKMCLWHGIPL